jgi:hypothetical protein
MALKNFASRRKSDKEAAIKAVETVPNPKLSASPSSATPLAGSEPTVSPPAMKKGGKVAGKLAKRGYGICK